MSRLVGVPGRLVAAPARLVAAPKVARSIYLSPEWKALLARVIARRGRRCEDCGASGCRIYGDHVVEIRDGGAELDEGNVRLRCAACHGKKTAAERRRRLGLVG